MRQVFEAAPIFFRRFLLVAAYSLVFTAWLPCLSIAGLGNPYHSEQQNRFQNNQWNQQWNHDNQWYQRQPNQCDPCWNQFPNQRERREMREYRERMLEIEEERLRRERRRESEALMDRLWEQVGGKPEGY